MDSRFSHPGFTRKIPKGITPCDYDKNEKLIEVEYSDGNRNWIDIKEFFGKVISEAKEILLLHPDGATERMNIIGIECSKVKRTEYWRLIFEKVN
ncbi:MAG: hypothetical protein A3F72_03045 [Bacteroidetes bacterium RIFCSPLOWO2_12_FULL_35_15]|nr:MAG: hypothetical protein A3F72_03045 [Bacteroidetes bacterium RIFCSPLOWO2_12_FULL_35_15]